MRTVIAQIVAVGLALIGAAILITAMPSPAHSAVTHVEPADTHVRHQHVTYSELVTPRVLYVELNDGSAHKLTPCHYEDSVNCWWDAFSEGNHRGHSFVALGHRGTTVRVMYLNRAYAHTHDFTTGDGYHDNDGASE